jgi:hypothetical protein
MVQRTAGWLLAGLLAAAPAWAQTVRVEAVQFPAWLERGGRTVPLTPGTPLQARDTLRTGANARVRLRLAEGSAVKLGENAQFVVRRAEHGGVFRAALSVVAGAFRFTGEAVRKRDIAIEVRNMTLGIRGTDVWGKSTAERSLACLIEGRVSVEAEGHAPVTLDRPLDFYQRVGGGAPQVSRVAPQQLEEWTKETEIPADGAEARAGGRWRVVAAVFEGRDQALGFNRRLRAQGYPSEVAPSDGRFLVQIPGLAGEDGARALMASLRGMRGVSLPHVKEGR